MKSLKNHITTAAEEVERFEEHSCSQPKSQTSFVRYSFQSRNRYSWNLCHESYAYGPSHMQNRLLLFRIYLVDCSGKATVYSDNLEVDAL